jgi:hypothetical protein
MPTATTTTTTKQNVNPAVYFVYSGVKNKNQLRSFSCKNTCIKYLWNRIH